MKIQELRKQMAGVDRRILELVADRQKLATAIGRAKERHEQTIRDFGQEREVIQRARAAASELEISTEVSEELMQLLIRYSLTVQELQLVARSAEGSGRRALIVGGAGRMGRWFVRFLLSQDFEVEVADPAGPVPDLPHLTDWRESRLDHDLIVVAADLRTTRHVLEGLAERRPAGTVFDIGSLKTPLRQSLRTLVDAGVQVTSIHPLFGPDTELLSGRHVIFVDLGVPEATRRAERLFSSTMARQVRMTLDDHDRFITYVLGLSHALNISFFTALADSGESAARLAGLSSTTFHDQLEVAGRVAQENPRLYFEIQALNEYGSEALSVLHAAVERLRSVVQARDESAFVELMESGRRYLAGLQQTDRAE
jgi:chorismate mutase/prephenate dehydrogenase